MIVFIDESGNTGTQIYKESWNFKEQPVFVLCAISIPEDNKLDNAIQEVFLANNIKGELKFSNKSHRKIQEKLLPQLYNLLLENQCNIYIEAVNKKYAVSQYVNDYCVIPYYDMPPGFSVFEKRLLKMNFANYVYQNTPDILLGEIANIFDNNDHNIEIFIGKCKELKWALKDKNVKECIDQTIDLIIGHKELGLKEHNLFPLIDYNKGGNSTAAIIPQVDSFNNIISRISAVSNTFNIVHDEQKQLSDALNNWVEQRNKMSNLACNISFENSRSNVKLQIADYLAGSIRVYLEEVIQNPSSRRNDCLEEIINKNTNFVSDFNEQCIIFNTNEELLTYKKWYGEFFSM